MPFLLTEKLKSQVTKNPLKNIICFKTKDLEQELNYNDFYKKSLFVAKFLLKQNILKEEPIIIILENRPEWGIVYFGILFSGAVCVPLDAQLTYQEIKNIISDCKPKIIFCSQKTILQVKQAIEVLDFIKEIILIDEFFKKDDNLELKELPLLNLNSPCSILYTSGTTAKSKAVVLTHRNFSSNFESIQSLNIVNQNDNFLSILPLHHSYPFTVTLLLPLFIGAKITYLDTLNPEELINLIREKKITIFVAVPQILLNLDKGIFSKIKKIPLFMRLGIYGMLQFCWFLRRFLGLNISKIIFGKVHENFASLRLFVSGGAKLDPAIAKDFFKLGFNLVEGYGLTETSPIVTINAQKDKKISSVGKPIPGVEIKIIDPDEKGTGEIVICGDNVMQGYYQNPLETNQVLKDNWFYSGDLGYIDRDGYLYIQGRKKEVLVLSSGKNIYPEEIENHYLKSLFIKEICVFTKLQNNLETLQAVIVPNYEEFKRKGIVDIRNKIKWELDSLSVSLPNYKHIMGFVISNQELPRTRLGKLKRYEIENSFKKQFQEQHLIKQEILSQEDQELLNSETAQGIIRYLKETKFKKINLYDHLELDLGIDSLGRIELILDLEKNFGIKISEDSLRQVFSVKDLILKINEILKEGIKIQELRQETKFLWQDILKQDPSGNILERINLKPNLLARLSSSILSIPFYIFFKTFFQLKIKGIENLKIAPPYALCPNHGSYLDGVIVNIAVGQRIRENLFSLGYQAYFDLPIIRHFIKLIKVIPLDPASNLVATLETCSFILRNRKVLCIFPEGQRSIDGKLQEFKKGIGILAKELNVAVVPVYIKGSFEAWPRYKKFPRPRPIEIIFGKPCLAHELKKKDILDEYQAIAQGLKEKIEVLSLSC